MVSGTYTVELATAAGAFPTAWTDITAYVKAVSITRGRDDTLSQVQPGTATITLINDDGRFSPAYTLSPLYPNVALMRAIRIKGQPGGIDGLTFAQIAALTFDQLATYKFTNGLYYGYVQSITPQPQPGMMEAQIQCSDGFTWLDLASGAPTYTSGTVSSHAAVALDAASWPSGARNIATGLLTFTPTFTDSTYLSQLQTVVNDNEGGLVFMDANGAVVVQDQATRFAAPYLTSVATLTDADAIASMEAERPIRDIANEVKVTYNGGTVTKTDAPSQTAYGPRRLNLTAGFLGGTDADDWASWLLSQRKDPKDRIVVSFVANKSSDLLLHAMVRDLSDRITVTDATRKTGVSGDYHIERIEHQIGNGGLYHVVTWQLSPVVPYSRQSIRVWWTLGTSTLGTGTRLAY